MKNRSLNLLVVLASITFSLVTAYAGGIDLNWDLLNYHLYSGYAFVHNLLGKDFMAAGLVSYLNPLPNVPFYLMIDAGWNSWAIGIVLSLVHAMNLLLLWVICRQVLNVTNNSSCERFQLTVLGFALGAASPIFISEIGTSYADISISVLVLGGITLLLESTRQAHARAIYILASGLMFGAALGLKLTHAPFALAAGIFACASRISFQRRVRFLVLLALGGLLGSILTNGYWAFQLYREFGNPLFPFANAFFQSPDYPPVSFVHRRFLPQSIMDALALPFHLALPRPWVYTEVMSPDIRFATFFTACIAIALLTVFKGKRVFLQKIDLIHNHAAPYLFLGYIGIAWLIWTVQFANGRYFLPLGLLIGPAIAVVCMRLFPIRIAVYLTVLCFVIQVSSIYIVGEQRFGNTVKWGQDWFTLTIPEVLKKNAYLYLSMDLQSNSYLAAFVHPGSRFVNINGMTPLDLQSPGGNRLRNLLNEFDGQTRILFSGKLSTSNSQATARLVGALNTDLNRLGLHVIEQDCVSMLLRGVRDIYRPAPLVNNTKSDQMQEGSVTTSCGVVRTPTDAATEAQRTYAAALFNHIERLCPRQFPTRVDGVVMRDRSGHFWTRYYVDTDLWLYVSNRSVIVRHNRFPDVNLGDPDTVAHAKFLENCSKIVWRWAPTVSLSPTTADQ